MDQFDVLLLEPLRVFLRQTGDFLPRLVVALVVLILGWFVAKAARFAVARALRAMNFHVLTERAGIDGFLRNGGVPTTPTDVLALLVYWLVIFAALLIGFQSLGLTTLTEVAGRVMLFVPRLMAALLILVFGTYFARFLGAAITAYCRNVNIRDAELLGRLAQYAVVTFVVLIALDQVGIGGDIVRQSFLIVLAGLVFALALAFGLGGRDWAAQWLERWWPRKKGSEQFPGKDRGDLR